MVLPAAQYAAVPSVALEFPHVPFVMPNRPTLDILPADNGPTVARKTGIYTAAMTTFSTAISLERQLKAMILKAVPETYIIALKNDLLGYANVRTRRILQHLHTTYGTVDVDEMHSLTTKMESNWDPNSPIEEHIGMAKRCQDASAHGTERISDATLLRTLLTTFDKSGVLESAGDKWREKAAADQTWDNFQTHFIAANKTRLRKTTAKGLEYNTANKASSTKDSTKSKTANDGGTGMHYCWSHGLGFNANHTSATCTNKADGHVDTATLTNMCGGNNTIRRKRDQPQVYKPKPRTSTRTEAES
jgi:hypothetical protein